MASVRDYALENRVVILVAIIMPNKCQQNHYNEPLVFLKHFICLCFPLNFGDRACQAHKNSQKKILIDFYSF